MKDLTVSLEKAEADASTRANNGWRATVGTLKDASIEFTVLNKEGDSAFGLLPLHNARRYFEPEWRSIADDGWF